MRRYLLRVGDYHTGVKDEFERELPVERIVLHRNYWAGSNDNDIALVRMRGREGHCLSFNHHVLPICLPDRRERSDINRQACIISGWGDTGEWWGFETREARKSAFRSLHGPLIYVNSRLCSHCSHLSVPVHSAKE